MNLINPSTWDGCNNCPDCTAKPPSEKGHRLRKCCIICRNYTTIDKAAIKYSLSAIEHQRILSGRSLRQDLDKIESEIIFLHTGLENAKTEARHMYQEYTGRYNTYSGAMQNYDATSGYAMWPQTFRTSARANEAQAAMNMAENAGRKAKNVADIMDKSYNDKVEEGNRNVVWELAKFLLKQAGLRNADDISRARFFFVWIAASIEYNTTRATLPEDPIRTLTNGSHYCAGISRLFKEMFDCTSPPYTPKSVYIEGNAKASNEKRPTSKNLHAWNAFPYKKDPRRNEFVYKIIDCTWGAGNAGDEPSSSAKLEATWFTKPNEAFLHDHLPLNPDTHKGKLHQYIDEPFCSFDFWAQSSPWLSGDFDQCHLDESAIVPKTSPIRWAKQRFKYRTSCSHVPDAKVPLLALQVNPSMMAFDTLVWPVHHPADNCWVMDLDLGTQKYRNYDKIYLVRFQCSNDDGRSWKPIWTRDLQQLRHQGYRLRGVPTVVWDRAR